MRTIRIALYEDDPQFRDGLTWLLATEPAFEVVGDFASADTVVTDLATCCPDVVLMDVLMPPGINGIEALIKIRMHLPDMQVIMLTGIEDDEVVFAAIRAGASGYLLKSKAANELTDAIRAVMDGGSPMTPRIAKKVLAFFQHPPKAEDMAPKTDLTPRETEILRSLTKGYSHKMIAAEHHIALDTVRNHLRKVYEKLRVHSMTEAVAKALSEGIV